ncbi:uncharacterized protein LOC111137341 isoform X2 [Crassostrea virginica]
MVPLEDFSLIWKRHHINRLDFLLQDRILSQSDQRFLQEVSHEIKTFSDRTPKSQRTVLIFPVVNSYHRFLIHKIVESFPELHSFSIGQDPYRRTVVTKVDRIDQEETWFMSAPRPQSSRGRGRGRAGGQSVNINATQDQSPQDNNNVSPAGVNRQRKKKPEVQRYVPRGRRLLNQQEEDTHVEQIDSLDSSAGDNFASSKEGSGRNSTDAIPEQLPSRISKKRTKNEVYVPPGRRSAGEPDNSVSSGSDKEVRQFEDVHAGATESVECCKQKSANERNNERREPSEEIVMGENSRAEEQSRNDFHHKMESQQEEEEGMEACEESACVDDCVEQNMKEKVENISESERTCLPVESDKTAGVMESESHIEVENEDDTPLNWDDDVEDEFSKEREDSESRLKAKADMNAGGIVQAAQVNESKSEVKKIKLKKKKKSKALNEGKGEEEAGTVEKKGKKKSSRSNITVFDMMNMNELREEKTEEGEKKAETKVEEVTERKVEETVPKGENSEREAGEEDSWDTMFDDDGECVDPSAMDELTKTVGKVKIEKATINYLDFKPKEPDYDDMNHVIEIFDFPAEFKTEDLMSVFSQFKNKGFDIKWVDDTHALGVFSSVIAAQDALKMIHPLCKVGPLSESSKACKAKARKCVECYLMLLVMEEKWTSHLFEVTIKI